MQVYSLELGECQIKKMGVLVLVEVFILIECTFKND